MSQVTNILLSDDSIGSSECERHKSIQTVLNLAKIDCETVGGNKCLEDDLFVGAFNYLDLENYIQKVRDVFKDDIGDVQLFVKEQDDEKWREVDLKEEKG